MLEHVALFSVFLPCFAVIVSVTTVQVYSAYRLVDRVAKAGKTIAVVNLGQTRPEKTGLQVFKASTMRRPQVLFWATNPCFSKVRDGGELMH